MTPSRARKELACPSRLTDAVVGGPPLGREGRAEAAERGSGDPVPQLSGGRLPRHPDLLQQPHHPSASAGPGEAAEEKKQKKTSVREARRPAGWVFFQTHSCSSAALQRDPILAKQLFSALFAGVLREMEKAKPRKESARVTEQLRANMNAFLSKSALCFPPFIACVQVRTRRGGNR